MTTQSRIGHAGTSRGRSSIIIGALFASFPFACSSSQPESVLGGPSALGAPTLGVAASFLVLGGSTVTNTGPSTILGDLGVNPGLAVTGFPPGLLIGGTMHAGDATALQAQNDVTSAYNTLEGYACAHDLTGQDLGGLTLKQGVYCFSSEAQLTGELVLDAEGDPAAVFVFQIASKLTTASNASISHINSGQDCRTFWQVGSSATLGTDTVFAGSILALTSITLDTRASVSGKALARNGAVTLDTNHVFCGTCADTATGADAGVDGGEGGSGTGGAAADSSVGGSGGNVGGSGGSTGGSGAGGAAADSSVGGSGGNVGGSGGSIGGSGAGGAAADSSVGGSGGTAGGDAGTSLCCNGVLCGAVCINFSGDNSNCGSCGHACASDENCVNGSCAPCTPVCGGKCVYLDSNESNCGSCGHACATGEHCAGGACVPCSSVCGGWCVDITADQANCGACGNACASGEHCASGLCVPCAAVCAGWCVDLESDQANCGSCGHSCAPGESCKSGSCMCQ